jgi:hypothetical protein
MPSLFDELILILDNVADLEFRNTIIGFLTKKEETSLPLPTQQIDRVSFLGFLKSKGKLGKYKKHLKKKFPQSFQKKNIKTSKSKKQGERVPFTNREDEIEKITSTPSESFTTYYLVHAPSGYGKTDLLLELDKWFKSKKWHHAYAVISDSEPLSKLAKDLAVNLRLRKFDVNKKIRPGLNLGGEIISYYSNNSSKHKGLILLIDIDKTTSETILSEIINEFIPDIYKNLYQTTNFKGGRIQFRIVLAGRNLAASKEIKFAEHLRFVEIPLSPFTYKVIKTTVDKYLIDYDPTERHKLAAHILFITGGHPGCMAKILELFKKRSDLVDEFFVNCKEDIKRIILLEIVTIKADIPKGSNVFSNMLEALMAFRYVGFFALDAIRLMYDKEGEFKDNLSLEAKLQESYLFTRDQYVLHDDVVRRLIMASLRASDQETYVNYSKHAREICEKYLRGHEEIKSPPIWVIEYLFQWLQENSINNIDNEVTREKLRFEFFEKILPYSLELFLSRHPKLSKEQCIDDKLALLSELRSERHWEFEFAVNYFFRIDAYANTHYQELLKRIEELMTKKYQEVI